MYIRILCTITKILRYSILLDWNIGVFVVSQSQPSQLSQSIRNSWFCEISSILKYQRAVFIKENTMSKCQPSQYILVIILTLPSHYMFSQVWLIVYLQISIDKYMCTKSDPMCFLLLLHETKHSRERTLRARFYTFCTFLPSTHVALK